MSPLLLAVTHAALLSQAPAQAALDVPEFAVPFGCGLRFPVSQSHAVGSHVHNDTHAWDFKMPEGIPIVAAEDGMVRLARGDSRTGGCDAKFAPEANYVVIAHPNGLETQYLHFLRVVVKAGDAVKKGELLGFSGKTGWACGSHLHFKVARPMGDGWNNPSVTARIAGHGDPEVGAWIESPACQPRQLPVAEVTSPARPPQGLGGSEKTSAPSSVGKRALDALTGAEKTQELTEVR